MSVDAATLCATPFSLTSWDLGAADPRTCAPAGHTAYDNQLENLVLLTSRRISILERPREGSSVFHRFFLSTDILSADLATVVQVRSHTATFLDRI